MKLNLFIFFSVCISYNGSVVLYITKKCLFLVKNQSFEEISQI